QAAVGAAGAREDIGDSGTEFRKPAKGIAAALHRRRARMVRLAAKGDCPVEHAGDGVDETDRLAGSMKHRALLDVKFQEDRDVHSIARNEVLRIESLSAHRADKALACVVDGG